MTREGEKHLDSLANSHVGAPIAHTDGGTPRRVVWAVMKNTGAQVVGQTLSVGSKYLAYILIFRAFGPERFGEFSIILILLSFSEAILDFGFSDIGVREMAGRPDHRRSILTALAAAKLPQLALAYLLLVFLLLVLRYPSPMRWAGLIAGLELVCYSGILVYRGLFKAKLQIERDSFSEVISLVVYIGLLIAICRSGSSLAVLCAALVAARLVYLVLVFTFGRHEFSVFSVRWGAPREILVELRPIFRAALPVGISIFMVSLNTSLGVLMLSKMDSLAEVGLYNAAYRFVLPLAGIAAAFMGSCYPILSNYWANDRAKVGPFYQQSVDTSFVLGGAVFCGIQACAPLLMGLFGEKALPGAPILRVLGCSIAIMFLSSMVGPMFIVTGRTWLSLYCSIFGVLLNASLNMALIPHYHAMGAAMAAVGTELCVVVAALMIVQTLMGYWLRWTVLLKVFVSAGTGLCLVHYLGLGDSVIGGLVILTVYGLGLLVTRALRPQQFRVLWLSARERP